ncbi:hypothetical protein D3C72_2415390 [compost metagenome]
MTQCPLCGLVGRCDPTDAGNNFQEVFGTGLLLGILVRLFRNLSDATVKHIVAQVAA